MSAIDEFIKGYTPEQKNEINRIRKIISIAVPNSDEQLSYGVPTVKYMNRPLMHFAGYKNHMSLFPGPPTIEKFKSELGEYELAKGTIKYTLAKPIPEDLVKKMVEYNRLVIDANNNN